jgi:serine/threonine protein kinase HipA of HipAB toxin-antitoxin module
MDSPATLALIRLRGQPENGVEQLKAISAWRFPKLDVAIGKQGPSGQ